MPDALQCFFVFRIHRDVAEDAKIIACAEPRKMGLQNISKVWTVHGSHILFVGKQLDSAGLEEWYFRRQLARHFIFACQLARLDLARFHVWLIERIGPTAAAVNG